MASPNPSDALDADIAAEYMRDRHGFLVKAKQINDEFALRSSRSISTALQREEEKVENKHEEVLKTTIEPRLKFKQPTRNDGIPSTSNIQNHDSFKQTSKHPLEKGNEENLLTTAATTSSSTSASKPTVTTATTEGEPRKRTRLNLSTKPKNRS